MESTSPHAGARNPPRTRYWGWFLLMLTAAYITLGPKVNLSRWNVRPESNAALEEALQWRKGSLALEKNTYEVATVDGKRYNVVGPAFVFLSIIGVGLSEITGSPPGVFANAWLLILIVLPLPIIAFWAFHTVTDSAVWAAGFAYYLIAATPLAPILGDCETGSVYYFNHVLTTIGLLVISADLLGARRLWPALIGLALADWSRQMTAWYALPIFWIAWSPRPTCGRVVSNLESQIAPAFTLAPFPRSARRAALGILFIAAVPMTLNTIKFGNPFETGYASMMSTHNDPVGRRSREALVSLRYIPNHLKAMLWDHPRLDIRQNSLYLDTDGLNGVALWLTNPLIAAVAIYAKKWWRDLARRALMLTSFLVIAALSLYHTTGSENSGFYRYAMDFLPVWLLVIAPYVTEPRFRSLFAASLACSALYFHLLP